MGKSELHSCFSTTRSGFLWAFWLSFITMHATQPRKVWICPQRTVLLTADSRASIQHYRQEHTPTRHFSGRKA
ncbi:hypothetical protein BDW75DRAFT_222635 [Aspergillus navahoensis]